MPYATDRLIHDADAHIMETPGWLDPYLDPGLADKIGPRNLVGGVGGPGPATQDRFFARAAEQQADPAYRARDEELITIRKNWDAPGSWIAADRPAALDHLGFASQLGWIASQGGEDVLLFSSDYPHVEGGPRRSSARAGLSGSLSGQSRDGPTSGRGESG